MITKVLLQVLFYYSVLTPLPLTAVGLTFRLLFVFFPSMIIIDVFNIFAISMYLSNVVIR